MTHTSSHPASAVPDSAFVSLVGAGPGHPDFLTLRGLRRLEAAEVILPDALLDPGFADLYPRSALVEPVGKRCGRPSAAQEAIHERMIHHARRGARVVRLKNGDPLLFGRGLEEAQALAEAGVPFEIVPGVSALQAGAAAAGLGLTHRGLADEVRIFQGHDLLDRDRDWSHLAQVLARKGPALAPTLALFMGTRSLPAIARRLLEAGAPADLPVVLVENATCAQETVTRSILAHAAAGRLTPLTGGPGILYLGPAAALRIVPHAHPESPSKAAPLPGPECLPRAAGGGRANR